MNKVSIDRSFLKIATNQNVLKVVENATVVLKIKGREFFINFSALIIFLLKTFVKTHRCACDCLTCITCITHTCRNLQKKLKSLSCILHIYNFV